VARGGADADTDAHISSAFLEATVYRNRLQRRRVLKKQVGELSAARKRHF
jgi:hypothetical protein